MKIVPEILKKIKGQKKTIFRGHANKSWRLKPSIGRYYRGEWSDVVEREEQALKEFKLRSIPYVHKRPESDMEWLALMQHHGCSTRLIDFTTNPLIALFFASDPSEKADGEVIVLTYKRVNEKIGASLN